MHAYCKRFLFAILMLVFLDSFVYVFTLARSLVRLKHDFNFPKRKKTRKLWNFQMDKICGNITRTLSWLAIHREKIEHVSNKNGRVEFGARKSSSSIFFPWHVTCKKCCRFAQRNILFFLNKSPTNIIKYKLSRDVLQYCLPCRFRIHLLDIWNKIYKKNLYISFTH